MSSLNPLFMILTLLLATLLKTTKASESCVAGGPPNEVYAASTCCDVVDGTWYQKYDVQAICVMDDGMTTEYEACTESICGYPPLDQTCIPASGPSDFGY